LFQTYDNLPVGWLEFGFLKIRYGASLHRKLHYVKFQIGQDLAALDIHFPWRCNLAIVAMGLKAAWEGSN